MTRHAPAGPKIDQALTAVLTRWPDEVVGIFAIGSITQEATPASDLDVAVIFRDAAYRENAASYRGELSTLARQINHDLVGPELTMWASKEDHYKIFYPDVSYVQANLPNSLERLDAWCGLAKHTLINYEAATGEALWGDFDISAFVPKVPANESVELFLIATRALAEGLTELASNTEAVQRSGRNHVAKAGLRAAYAALIRADRKPRNSYLQIHDQALEHFSTEWTPTIDRLYDVKVGRADELPEINDVLALMRHCEVRVSPTARLVTAGLAVGRAGESFAFPVDSLLTDDAPAEAYRRFPGFGTNYYQAFYFVLTAHEVVRRLAGTPLVADADVMDFYLEELLVTTALALSNPGGLRMVVGRAERHAVDLTLGPSFLQAVAPCLITLAKDRSRRRVPAGVPWLQPTTRDARLYLVVAQLDDILGLGARDLTDELRNGLDQEDLLDAVEWQALLMQGIAGSHLLDVMARTGLTMYQGGSLDRARRILESATAVSPEFAAVTEEIVGSDPIGARGLSDALSRALHYLALTLHRQGETESARRTYLAALERDPENVSALDDLTVLLLTDAPNVESTELLEGLVERFHTRAAQARRQLSDRYMVFAVDLRRQGKAAQARTWYRRAMHVDPGHAVPCFNLAVLEVASGNLSDAEALYRRALELDPGYAKAPSNLALLLEGQGRADEAVAVWRAAISSGAVNEYIHTNYANHLLTSGGDREAARRHYLEALRINEGHADAHLGIAQVLLADAAHRPAELRKAATHLERAYRLDPTLSAAREQLQVIKRFR